LGSSKSPRQRPTGPAPWLRKNGALAIGCVAGAALVVLARSPLLDAEGDINREIELITRSVEAEVQRAWDSPGFRPNFEPILSLENRTRLPKASEKRRPIFLTDDERTSAFDALFATAARAERDGKIDQALIDLEDARKSTDDPRRWLLADLRSTQLAARALDRDVLARSLKRLLERVDGSETVDGVSVLLTALATSLPVDAQDHVELIEAQANLESRGEEALAAGSMALPAIQAELDFSLPQVKMLTNPERAIYLEPLVKHGGKDLAQLVTRRLERDRLAWITEHFGTPVPRPGANVLAPISDEAKRSFRSGHDSSMVALTSQRLEIWAVPQTELLEQLEAWLREAARVPEEIRIRLVLDSSQHARYLPRRLAATPFGVLASLMNPKQYREEARASYRWLRILLHALGLMCALLGFALHRQRQRELAVQHLKSEFVANVSHELRTPLSSILLMAENLSGGKVNSDTQARYHELILRESQRLRRLVDDVLDFSRLDRGEGPRARIETVSLSQFGADLHAELQAWAEQHGAQLAWNGIGLTGEAALDVEALRRAVFNLADNALRHSGSTQINLEVEADARQLQLRLRDYGKGLPEGSEERIFRPFEQLNPGSTAGKGAGLGLAIVAEIARAHGGKVDARNLTDGGTLFTMTLSRHVA
jgi:signal transduction histidine kinase